MRVRPSPRAGCGRWGGWGQLLGQEAAALAEEELLEDDADPPEDPSEELPDEPDVELDVEPAFSEPVFVDSAFSELDLSGLDLLSESGWGLSEEPDSVGGAERLSVR
ncbi:MAG: hypothetical protein ACRDTC_17345 [Pseudonocardiaceae bacterium]